MCSPWCISCFKVVLFAPAFHSLESSQSAESMGQIGDQLIGSSTQEQEERLTDLSRQVGRKWSMLARYAGLKEDEVQEIKDAQEHAEDRSCVAMEKIQGRLTWNELLFIVHKQVSSS